MSTVGNNKSTIKMPTGSSRRKARVPHHITRQPLLVDDDIVASDIEDAMDIKPSFFDPATPSTSSEAVCNGTGTGEDSTREDEEVKVKEEPVLPEGTVIVQPEAVPDNESDFEGPEFKSKVRTRRMAQKENDIERAHCTSCHKQVNHLDSRSFKPHPILKVILCRRCFDYYQSGKFSQDDEGIDEQCRWCAEGGSLICCDFCTNAFCKKCIKHNLGRSTLSALISSENTKWRCYGCDPEPLRQLRMKCKSALEGLKKLTTQKPSKSRRRHTGDSIEASEADDYVEFLHPSISKVSVSLQFKPNHPTLEISSDGLRILRPQEGDRWGLKMALWIMRSLKRTTVKAEKEITQRLAAKPDKDTKLTEGDTVQLDISSKWMSVKMGNKRGKKTQLEHNGQTSHDSEPKLNQSKPSSSKETVKEQKDNSNKRNSSNRNNDTDDKSDTVINSQEEATGSEEVKNKLDEEKKSQSTSSEQIIEEYSVDMDTEETNQNQDTAELEKDDDQQLDKSIKKGTPCKDIEEKDCGSKSTVSDAKDTDKDEAEEEEKDLGDGEAEKKEDKKKAGQVTDKANAEGGEVELEGDKGERSDQDIECEKALMDEIEGMGSNQSGEDEISTPKKETKIASPFKITPLRIKIEKISTQKIAKSKEDGSKSPRRQKTTPKSPRHISQKPSSDSSDLDRGIASDPEKVGKKVESPKIKVSKELLEKKEDEEGSSDLTETSDDGDSSSSKGSDWKAQPRRSARRHKGDGEEVEAKGQNKKKKKKRKQEKKKSRKNQEEDSSSEVDFPKTPDLKKKARRKGPGLDSSNQEEDSDAAERLITPRKSKKTPRGSKRLKVTPKTASKSTGKSKVKVRDSDSSNFDSDLERQMQTFSKAPGGKKKPKDDIDEGESAPEDSDSLKDSDNVEPMKPKEKAPSKKTKSPKSKKDKDSDSSSDSEEEDSEKDGDQSGDDVQHLENNSGSDLGPLEDGGHGEGEEIDSDLENKLAEKQLMEEIEAELSKGDSEDDEEDDETSDDSEKPKRKRKKKAKDSDSGDEFNAASDEEGEDEDDNESDSDEEESSSDEKSSKKKKHGRRHRLMRVKLGETESEDSDEDASGSDTRKKKLKKRKRGPATQSSDSDSDEGRPKKGGKRGRARKRSSSNSDEDSNDVQKERSYNRGKGKKRRRIKVATDSETDDQKVKGSDNVSFNLLILSFLMLTFH